MKKILILSFAVLMLFSTTEMFGRILISTSEEQRSNGGLVQSPGDTYVGYDNVWELHESNYDLLHCENPGFLKCKWTNKPSQFHTQPSNDDLEDYADEQIADNVLSGSYNNIVIENGITYYRFLVWDHNPLTNITQITINVYLDFYID